MKFSTPGHSYIQEMDNIHSNIEKVLKISELWSPVSLIRLLLFCNRKSSYDVIQMKTTDFRDYHTPSKALHTVKYHLQR